MCYQCEWCFLSTFVLSRSVMAFEGPAAGTPSTGDIPVLISEDKFALIAARMDRVALFQPFSVVMGDYLG